jgi:hypothetical protein
MHEPQMTATEAQIRAMRASLRPASPQVTADLFEQETLMRDPLLYRAVQAGITQEQLIKHLVEETTRLRSELQRVLELTTQPMLIGPVDKT